MATAQHTASDPRATHLRDGEGTDIWVAGSHHLFKIRGEGQGYSLFESLTPPNEGPPPHIHRTQDEAFYVISGEFTFYHGADTIVAGPGSFVFIPRGTAHTFRTTGTLPGKALTILTPPGPLERFFDEVGIPVEDRASFQPPPGPPDVDAFVASGRRQQIEFLLPPQ